MAFMDWLTATEFGKYVATFLVSMVPVIELRGGIPFGVALGLSHWGAFFASVAGNLFPVPFILMFIRRIFWWMRTHMPRFNNLVDRMERKAHTKGRIMQKYSTIGLCLLVAIPLPGTGAWTGSLVAALLDIRMKKAIPSIAAGVLIAGFLVSGITYGFVFLIQ